MAKKKKTTKKSAAKNKMLSTMPAKLPTGKGCDLPHICKYINGADGTGTTDGLRKFLDDFWADYKALRVAVCNVEKQAFTSNGVNFKPPKFCTGGTGTEPADPPKPPKW